MCGMQEWIRAKQAEAASKNRFHDSPSGPKFKTAIVAWTMCEGWWTEARNVDEKSGMQARGTKQCESVEDTPREFPWIPSGSLTRDFWSAVEYGRVPEFLSRLKARGHALMAKKGQGILLDINGNQKGLTSLSSWLKWQWQWSLELCQKWQLQTSATGNEVSWNLGPLGMAAQPYITQAMWEKAAIVMLQENGFPEEASSEFSEISGESIQSTDVALLQATILT